MPSRKRAIVSQGWEAFLDFLSDLGVYMFAVVGVFFSKYFQEFRAGTLETVEFNVFYFMLSCVVAFIVAFGQDFQTGDEQGKRNNWKRRAVNSLSNGVLWHMLIGG